MDETRDGSPELDPATRAKVEQTLRAKAEVMTEEDVAALAGRAEEVDRKVAALPGRLRKARNQARLLLELVRDYARGEYREVPWWSVASGAAALLYLLAPIDVIPDPLPVIGFIDDALVIGLVMLGINEDLRDYVARTGRDPKQYF